MEREQLKEKINSLGQGIEFAENKQFVEAVVPATIFHNLCKSLHDNRELEFDFLISVTAVDWVKELVVVYHLTSIKHHHMIVLKQKIPDRNNPSVDSVADIWRTAEFQEREIFDLFGINFNNHPDMRRLFLEDDWKGYPLRKDYVDEINIIER